MNDCERRIRELETWIENVASSGIVDEEIDNILKDRLPPLKKWVPGELCKVLVSTWWREGIILRLISGRNDYLVAYIDPKLTARLGWCITRADFESITKR